MESYSFEVDSGRSVLFPILFESLSMSIHIGERSELFEFQQVDQDISEYEVLYDGQLLGYLKDFRSDVKEITLEGKVVETSGVNGCGVECSAEIRFVGYWIFLQKVPLEAHLLSLRRKIDASDLVRYKITGLSQSNPEL